MRRRYIYIEGELVEITKDYGYVPDTWKTDYRVMPDIKPYKSMIDGSEIRSRSQHREHLKQHGCVEVGNDSSLSHEPRQLKAPPGLKEKLIRNLSLLKEK